MFLFSVSHANICTSQCFDVSVSNLAQLLGIGARNNALSPTRLHAGSDKSCSCDIITNHCLLHRGVLDKNTLQILIAREGEPSHSWLSLVS